MGLLDLGIEDPNTTGLLSLGLRLMSTPGKFGTALGTAGLGAMGDMRQAQLLNRAQQQEALRQQMLEMQIAQAKQAQAEAQAQAQRDEAFRRSIPNPGFQASQAALAGGGGPTVANAAQIAPVDPRQQFLYEAVQARQIQPMDYFKATEPKQPDYKVVGDSLVKIGNGSVSEAFRGAPDPAKLSPVAQLMSEMNALPPGDPRRAIYQNAIIKATTHQPPANVSVNTGDNKFEAKAAEVIANQFSETYKQGQAATRALGQVNRLDGLLKKTGGGFTPAIKMYAGQFGVSTNGLDDLQAAEAVIQSLIPQQRPPGSGTMSDRDVELFRQSLPRLINQPGGNQKIINTMRALYEYDQKLGQISSDALSGRISRDKAMELMNALPNPLADLTGGEDIHSQADAIIRGSVNGKR